MGKNIRRRLPGKEKRARKEYQEFLKARPNFQKAVNCGFQPHSASMGHERGFVPHNSRFWCDDMKVVPYCANVWFKGDKKLKVKGVEKNMEVFFADHDVPGAMGDYRQILIRYEVKDGDDNVLVSRHISLESEVMPRPNDGKTIQFKTLKGHVMINQIKIKDKGAYEEFVKQLDEEPCDKCDCYKSRYYEKENSIHLTDECQCCNICDKFHCECNCKKCGSMSCECCRRCLRLNKPECVCNQLIERPNLYEWWISRNMNKQRFKEFMARRKKLSDACTGTGTGTEGEVSITE